jgi:hypothetical protein
LKLDRDLLLGPAFDLAAEQFAPTGFDGDDRSDNSGSDNSPFGSAAATHGLTLFCDFWDGPASTPAGRYDRSMKLFAKTGRAFNHCHGNFPT